MADQIRELLMRRGEELLSAPSGFQIFTKNHEADIILNDLRKYPHAYVLACVMDRQITAERAWVIPYEIKQRLGSFDFSDLKALPLSEVQRLMSQPKPLHRFTEIMASNFYSAIKRIETVYNGMASNIWDGNPSSATIVCRFLEFDGVGPKIATMATNILVRDFKIPVSDKISIDISADVHVRRVFTRLGFIEENASNETIIYKARELNPTYPGIFDIPAWEIGKNWCRPKNRRCDKCYLRQCCKSAIIAREGN